MTTPDGHIRPDMLVGDINGPFVPKSEDTGVTFPLFDGTSQDDLTSSAVHIPSASSFDSGPGSSHPVPPVSLTQVSMDALDSVATGDPSGAFMNGFASTQQKTQMSNSGNDDMQGITPIREQSPGSVHTPSSNPSHAASPIPPPFSNVSTSSLASALDEPTASFLSRSRSGSLASPSAATGFVPRTSPPQTAQESSFSFSLPPEVMGISRPDPVTSPHMLVVDDVLNSIMRAAASARQACSMGQGGEATSKIDEMKKQIALVSELLSNTGIDSPPSRDSPRGQGVMSSGSAPSTSSGIQGHRHSMSLPRLSGNAATPPGFIPNFPNSGSLSISSGPTSLEQAVGGPLSMDLSSFPGNQGSPDSDTSRKRCASTMPGDRFNKAIRLDSSDGNLPMATQESSPPRINLNLSAMQSQQHPASQGSSVLPSPVAPLPGNGRLQLSHSISSSSLSASLTPVSNISAGSTLSGGAQPPAGISASLPEHVPVSTARPGLMQVQTEPSFPVSLTSSMPLTDTGRRDIEAQLSMELTSPTNMSSGWSDLSGTTPMQSQLGSGIGTVRPHDIAGGPAAPFNAPPFPPPGHAPLSLQTGPVPMTPNPGLGSRSGSFSHPNPHQAFYGAGVGNLSVTSIDQPQQQQMQLMQQQHQQHHSPPDYVPSQDGRSRRLSRPTVPAPRSASSSSSEDEGDSDYEGNYGGSHGHSNFHSKSSPSLRSRPGSPHRRTSATGTSGSPADNQSGLNGPGSGNEIPPEYRADVDRIFFEFLNKVCSNLDATDSKGELIHQTLMAKKMQRLDESPDFRPFKFRIQAFTNGFLEELSRQGFSEEKIAMKKVRNYLWTQPYISRFNEDGKKAKSKGNHIWNIDAKKRGDGGWDFRPFRRKLAGTPPSIAYIGLRWTWTPRIWDPQASRTNIQVQYSSPNLPSWLSWRDNQLQGVPPPDAQSCEVTVEARTMQDGKEELLVQSFMISVSPIPTGTDMSFSGVRPPMSADIHSTRRVNSDSIVPNVAGTLGRPLQAMPSQALQSAGLTPQDAQMMQVLTSAAQRVAQEAQAHVIASSRPHEAPGPELQSLAKQQHVLTVTAQALDQEVSALPSAVPPSSHALVAAAQQVVFQAARQVAADRSAVMSLATGVPPSQQPQANTGVTVNEVSVATQTAVAHAVEITGPLSSEVDVMITASSLLQHQQQHAPFAPPSLDQVRPHSTAASVPLSSMGSIEF